MRQVLEGHPDAVRRESEVTLRSILREESSAVRRVIEGRNTRYPLGESTHLPARLKPGNSPQRGRCSKTGTL